MIDLLSLTLGLITVLIIGLGRAWNNSPMVLIAAKMTDRLQVWLLLKQDYSIILRMMACRCWPDTSMQLSHDSPPAHVLTINSSSVLDKGFFRRYSERQIWCTTVGDAP